MYLNKWTPDFSPENDIPSVVPVWVCLSFNETIQSIGNILGRFIDRVEPRDGMQACARICVEVDLEKRLPEAIQLTLDNLSYIQQVDYEQLPLKCKTCHEYGHFAKNCPQNKSNPPKERAQEQWQQPMLECCARLTIDNITILSPNHRHKATPEHRNL
jgi:hypothetical protein